MDQKFSVPGKDGWEASVDIAKTFGSGGDAAPLFAVVTVPAGERVKAARADLADLESKIKTGLPGSRVAGYASTSSNAFVSKDGRTSFVIAYPTPDPKAQFGENLEAAKTLNKAVGTATVGGAPVRVTGYDALANDAGEQGIGQCRPRSRR